MARVCLILFFSPFLLFSHPIDKLMEKYQIPGAAIAYVKEGKIAQIQCYGFADLSNKTPLTENSLFQAASISKTVTAWAVVDLAHKMQIDLNKPIQANITPRMLLTHTAGLSVSSYRGHSPSSPLPTLIDCVKEVKRIYEPGKKFIYSGGGYTLLQHFIEERTGEKFANYMQEQLLEPLGLFNSSFSPSTNSSPLLCTPYTLNYRSLDRVVFTEQAAAGFYTSIRDLAFFVVAALSSSQLVEMVQTDEDAYALGFEVEHINKEILAFHLGANPGWRSGIFLIPSHDVGLVILTNSDMGTYLIQDLSMDWIHSVVPVTSKYSKGITEGRKITKIGILLIILFNIFLLLKRGIFKNRIICILSFVIWYTIFYTPVLIGWMILPFLPLGSKWISSSILFTLFILLLLSFTFLKKSLNRCYPSFLLRRQNGQIE